MLIYESTLSVNLKQVFEIIDDLCSKYRLEPKSGTKSWFYYAIVTNESVYIGKTTNLKRRFIEHANALEHANDSNRLQLAYDVHKHATFHELPINHMLSEPASAIYESALLRYFIANGWQVCNGCDPITFVKNCKTMLNSNRINKDSRHAKLSEANKKSWKNIETRQHRIVGIKHALAKPEIIEKRSKSQKFAQTKESVKQKRSNSITNVHKNADFKQIHSKAVKFTTQYGMPIEMQDNLAFGVNQWNEVTVWNQVSREIIYSSKLRINAFFESEFEEQRFLRIFRYLKTVTRKCDKAKDNYEPLIHT